MLGASKSVWALDPRTVPGCQLWLDGADTSTLFANTAGTTPASVGGTIGMWKDKSSNAHNYTTPSYGGVSSPTYTALGSITFYSGNVLINADTWSSSGGLDIFVVSKPWTSGTYNDWRTMFRGATNGHYGIIQQYATAFGFYRNGSGGGFYQFGSLTIDGSTRLLLCMRADTSYAISGALHGTATFSSASALVDTETQPFYALGGYNQPSQAASQPWGTFNEVLIYSTLTTTQRQQVEGYLSWKWGLMDAAIPSPLAISGLQLWMDGGDLSTMTFVSGTSNVTNWKSKGSTAITMSNNGAGYYPVYTPGLGMYFSNTGTAAGSAATAPGFTYTGGFTIPTQSFTAIVAMYALDSANYRNAVYISSMPGCNSVPNIILTFENGNSGYSANSLLLDGPSGNFAGHTVAAQYTTLCNTLRIDEIISAPGSVNMYINDVAVTVFTTSNSYTSPYTNFPVTEFTVGNSQLYYGGRLYYGYVQEILLYNSVLTTAQRNSVKTYLARKWGNANLTSVISLPVAHPSYYIAPTARLFNPPDIGGCKLWLDGLDQTSMTFSSGNLSTWIDKSGSGNTATSAGTAITVSSNGAYFGGSSYMTVAGLAGSIVNTPFVIFVVETLAANVNGYYFGDDTVSGTDATLHIGYRNSGQHTFAFYSDDLEDCNVSGTGTTRIWSHWLPSGANRVTRRNGATDVTHGNSNYLTQFVSPRIGRVFGTNNYVGTISEIVIYAGKITLAQIQQVEGYLAWRWRLNTNLPSTHPSYKYPTNTSLPFIPTDVATCALWLDSAGPTSTNFVLSGTTITEWVDKSGNGRSLGSPSGTVSYISGGGVQLGGSLYVDNAVDLTTLTFFIVAKSTAVTTNQTVFCAKPAGGNASWSSVDGFGFYMDNTTAIRLYGQPSAGQYVTYSQTTSSPSLFSFQSSGTSITAWFNGTSQTGGTLTSTRTGTALGFALGLEWGGTAYGGSSTAIVYEVLVYNSSITTQARQIIEGYLAQKWNI